MKAKELLDILVRKYHMALKVGYSEYTEWSDITGESQNVIVPAVMILESKDNHLVVSTQYVDTDDYQDFEVMSTVDDLNKWLARRPGFEVKIRFAELEHSAIGVRRCSINQCDISHVFMGDEAIILSAEAYLGQEKLC